MSSVLEVRAPGLLTTVQDSGRPGLADLGVGVSGAADRPAARLANRLVGNPADAAVLEVTFGGLVVAPTERVVVAVTGASGDLRVDGRQVDTHRALIVPGGAELRVGTPRTGLRSYVAVRGGVDPEPVLGSRSTDVLAGVGPPALAAGDRLRIGAGPVEPMTWVDVAPTPGLPGDGDVVALRVVPGPRDDWFPADAVAGLARTCWEVSPRSNRVGLRLSGPALERDDAHAGAELPSEGVVRGSIQVPPDGQPVVFLADHPVTGGYPVIGVLVDADTDRAGQLRPGNRVRLRFDRRTVALVSALGDR